MPGARGGTVRHRRALGKPRIDQAVASVVVIANFGDYLLNVSQVVSDRPLPAELGHPAGDHVLVCSIVEPVQRLHSGQEPCRRARNPFKLAQM